MAKRPLILISNDDGVQAQGIQVLISLMQGLGDVFVLAPDGPRSAAACSISPLATLRPELVREEPGLTVWQLGGTPSDCVKLAMEKLLPRRPDLMVSGINHGDNASVSLHYSGTVGAALEACMKQVPAIAYSLRTRSHECDFTPYHDVILQVARYVLQHGLPEDTLLNVNFPEVPRLQGTRLCRQSRGAWRREMEEAGQGAYRLSGYFENLEPHATDTDYWALDHGYAAITPIQLDMTNHELLKKLKEQGARGKGQENTITGARGKGQGAREYQTVSSSPNNPLAPCPLPLVPNTSPLPLAPDKE